MELKVRNNKPNYLEVEFVGQDIAIPSAIKEKLISHKDVEFASAKNEHSQVGNPVLVVRTDKESALDLVMEAIDQIENDAEEFKKSLKAAKKPK
jgi:DNA-directed RNA polymerase subunit L